MLMSNIGSSTGSPHDPLACSCFEFACRHTLSNNDALMHDHVYIYIYTHNFFLHIMTASGPLVDCVPFAD